MKPKSCPSAHSPSKINQLFRRGCLLAVGAVTLVVSHSAQAASTWNGGGGNVNWSTAGNWTGGTPTSNVATDLIFAGTTNLGTSGTPLNQNIGNPMILNSITFSATAGNFFLGGSGLAITAGSSFTITQSSANNQSIANAITHTGGNSPVTLALAGDGGGVVTLSGAITEGVGSGRTLGITKSGTSTFVLTASNAYTGLTTVSAGKLTVGSSGSINSTSSISIAGGEFNYNSTSTLTQAVSFTGTGGTLSGSGTINPAVTVTSGNTYSAGAKGDPGTQTITGGLTLASGSTFSWDLDAATTDPGANTANSGSYDRVTGTVNGTGIFNVVLGGNLFTDAFWDTNKSWNNIFSAGTQAFSLFSGTDGVTSVDTTGLVSGQGQFTYTGSTLSWAPFSPVPEPTSALAGILLGAGLLRRKRAR